MQLTVEQAVARLNGVTPFHARRQSLDATARAIHRAVLEGFFTRGHPPGRAALAERFGQAAVAACLARLAAADLVVPDAAGEPVGAYPCTAEHTPHRVHLRGFAVNAMCALDALAVGPMAGVPTVIESRCHVSGDAVRIEQDGARIVRARPGADLHFGLRWQVPEVCAAHSLCREMVFLRDAGTAQAWEGEADTQRSVFPLEAAVAFAMGFFMPLVAENADGA